MLKFNTKRAARFGWLVWYSGLESRHVAGVFGRFRDGALLGTVTVKEGVPRFSAAMSVAKDFFNITLFSLKLGCLDKFYQADESQSQPGNGLGLAVYYFSLQLACKMI
ncbi:MAG: hypothetical protein FWE40_06270 [Oscillospiraceae bacterium]|jgi:hypothetical protein|nr:hypothetical protein [Oscillospiraceae bacterium]